MFSDFVRFLGEMGNLIEDDSNIISKRRIQEVEELYRRQLDVIHEEHQALIQSLQNEERLLPMEDEGYHEYQDAVMRSIRYQDAVMRSIREAIDIRQATRESESKTSVNWKKEGFGTVASKPRRICKKVKKIYCIDDRKGVRL